MILESYAATGMVLRRGVVLQVLATRMVLKWHSGTGMVLLLEWYWYSRYWNGPGMVLLSNGMELQEQEWSRIW